MKVLKTLKLSILVFIASVQVQAQPAERRISRNEYIDTWKDEAVKQMLAHGIPASITLAQGILESADGNSALAKYANNHFGIKCHGWDGASFIQDDDHADECFRKYHNAKESFKDHSEFLTGRSRYASLFELKPNDYKGWARGLRKAGYATNPRYADLLIQIVEDHNLGQYDKMKGVDIKVPEAEELAEVVKLEYIKHKVKVHDNNINFIIAKEGDSFYKIAREFKMGLWQIYKYNDLSKDDVLAVGDVVYLQPKRSKSKVEYHIVQSNETMREISQMYGIKINKLYKKNNMIKGAKPEIGQKIYLKKKLS